MVGDVTPVQDIIQNVYDPATKSVKTTSGGGSSAVNVLANAGLDSKQVTVFTAGTPVALALGTTNRITIRADDGNSGNVVIGDATVTVATGYELTPGESTNVLLVDDATAALYVDAAISGDKVSVIYEF